MEKPQAGEEVFKVELKIKDGEIVDVQGIDCKTYKFSDLNEVKVRGGTLVVIEQNSPGRICYKTPSGYICIG